ncbi:MAG: tRNA pseudouridine(38-40) synthase TruA [Thermoguttaceae bacterium]
MRRIRLDVSYDGTHYAGWQTQPDRPTIQKTLENQLRQLTKEDIHVTGSGRTDAGVHAIKQVVAFSTESAISSDVFFRALNGLLPHDIRIRNVLEVPLSFHPIQSATSKKYRYLIDDNRPSCPMTRNYCWVYREPLDLETMQKQAAALCGTHDFVSFQTQGSPRTTTIRTVLDVSVQRLTCLGTFFPPLICIEVEATGFLYNMMRAISGTLALLGAEGKRKCCEENRMQNILSACNRTAAGPTAPPHGLYLLDVTYPD